METPLSVFINGISGVFAGMAVLYLAMKLNALAAGAPPTETEKKK